MAGLVGEELKASLYSPTIEKQRSKRCVRIMSFVCQRGVQLGGDPGCEMQQEFGVDDCAVARNVYSYGGSALAQVGGCRPVPPCS